MQTIAFTEVLQGRLDGRSTVSILGAFLPGAVIYARTCSQVGAPLHVHLHVESETQCTPTPRARKNGPFLGGTAKREIFLTVRIPPEPSLSAPFSMLSSRARDAHQDRHLICL